MGWPMCLPINCAVNVNSMTRMNCILEPDAYQAALKLLPESEREDVEERAAIIEFEGGANRDEAERQAILGAVQVRNEKKDQKLK